MDLHAGKLFEHKFEGLSICAGVFKSGYVAYRLEYEKPAVWYWNNKGWKNELPYKKSDWYPFAVNCNKVYEGCDCYYVDNGVIVFGTMEDEQGEHLGLLSYPNDYLCYIPRKLCHRLEWMANKKARLRVVA